MVSLLSFTFSLLGVFSVCPEKHITIKELRYFFLRSEYCMFSDNDITFVFITFSIPNKDMIHVLWGFSKVRLTYGLLSFVIIQ